MYKEIIKENKNIKKILIVGEIYSDNLGDAVLCDVVKKIVKENIYCDIELCDLSGREFYGKYFNYKWYERLIKRIALIFFKFNLINLGKINVLFKNSYYNKFDKSYDLVIFAGGQMFMDYFVFPIEKLIKFFKKRDIPVIFHACGAKKIENKNLEERLKKILLLDIVKSISIRDDINLVNTRYLMISKKKAVKIFDTALCTNEYFNVNKVHKESIVGLGIMNCDRFRDEDQINFWSNLIDELDKRKIKWQLFCNGSEADYKMLKNMVVRKNLNKNQYLMRPKTAQDLVNVISNFNKIISFRLHSHIIAASMGIPTIGISWEKKVNQFFHNLGLEYRCKTINTSVQDIVDCLELVEKEGINNTIIKKQSYLSKKSLLDNINRIIKS